MDFVKIEETGKKIFAKFPGVRRAFKKIYQVGMYIISKDKIKVEGNLTRISPDDSEYFYGYYDKSPWDVTDRYMISLNVKNAHKVPDSVEEGKIVVFDTLNNNNKIEIATTHCWNSQQGCMAQWLGPDFKSKIIYNDCRNNKYVSVIYDFENKKELKVLDMPIYDVSKDGKFALTLDFSRLHRLRKGYGYANIEENTKKESCPDKACIWKIDLENGNISEIVKYTDMANFEIRNEMKNAEHKVNHIMISPNGKRFMVLHRWFCHGKKFTRLVTMNIDGTDMYNLSDDNFVSHCCWKNNEEILSFLNKKETGKHYYLMRDKTNEYKMLWPELNTDGHCTYSPDGKFVITDTYPNNKRIASVYLCTEADNRARRILRVFSPFKYDNDVRCDLHPRWNHNSSKICIDSVHDGKKELYVTDIPKIDIERTKKVANENHSVTVVMATYNGEKYLREQLESVLNQKGVLINILVRDDGSTDKTTEILEEYQRNQKIKWYTGEHLNVQKGYLDLLRNAADTEYYAFCDQDDVWDDDKLLIAITELENLPKDKPALYYCGQRLVDENLKIISVHNINTTRNDYTNFLISNIAGCTAVFNKKLLEVVNSKKPKFILMHDSWIFKVCVAIGGNYYADTSAHINYRQHGDNVTGISNSIKGRFRQIKRYIFTFEIKKQLENLYENYSEEMTEEYRDLTLEICNYNNSLRNWIKFINSKKFDFKNKSLNFIVKLKIFLRKM